MGKATDRGNRRFRWNWVDFSLDKFIGSTIERDRKQTGWDRIEDSVRVQDGSGTGKDTQD
ncbi:hypothetical protein PSDT_1062 [Parascardovia denticolens DSM 10105 = JCM 12538]|nr:hypothetical protein PSDT_1062 [Parascardovia denticolens DSM 10105 = JCM 12538]